MCQTFFGMEGMEEELRHDKAETGSEGKEKEKDMVACRKEGRRQDILITPA